MFSIISAIIAGSLALVFAGVIALITLREGEGTKKVREIGSAIQDGAMTFLRREYTVLLPFVAIITVVLWLLIDFMQNDSLIPKTALSYLAGTALSGVSGFLGMNMAVRANTRTTNAATRGLNPALRIAFSSGTVMGMTVVGLGLLGITLLYLIFQDISIVAGFGLVLHPLLHGIRQGQFHRRHRISPCPDCGRAGRDLSIRSPGRDRCPMMRPLSCPS